MAVEASEDNKNEGITSMFDTLAEDAAVNGMGACIMVLKRTRLARISMIL